MIYTNAIRMSFKKTFFTSLSLFTVLLLGVATAGIVFLYSSFPIFAATIATSVTVGNSAPTFTAGPAESVASTATNPTNVGSAVTFEATATDSNNESYYFIVCKTNAVTPGSEGGAPSCGGGSWCVSTVTSSGQEATCDYTAQSGDDEVNAWYGFVCDNNATSSSCSTAAQGSGDSASPFEVNHAPSFTAVSNDGPKNPGETVTWTTTASDADESGVSDTVKLIVCKTAGISGGDCDGGASDRWCVSSAGASNPSCGYELPTPTPDDSYDAYVYVVDNHDFAASGGVQASNDAYTVNNVAPVVSSVVLNGDAAIDLTSNTTTEVLVTATITDNNSCAAGEIDSVVAHVYRSAVTAANCGDGGDANDNNCYPVVTCTVVGGTCSGTTDASANYTCSVDMQYFADPTDADTPYTAQNWLATVVATDDDAQTDATETSAGVEVNSLTAMSITSSIAYGSLDVGQKNDPLDKTTTITATGNVGLDQELSGTDMESPEENTIGVQYQRYALASSTAYASGTSLSTTATEVTINVLKTISASSPASKNTWWGIEIPSGTLPGTYSGENTITALKSDSGNWYE